MSSDYMPEKLAIAFHLSDKPESHGMKIDSGFVKALKEARKATGRATDTGEKIDGQEHDTWIGAIAYMALLDQISSCFKPRNTPELPGKSILKALAYFSKLPEPERQVLYALRCAFAYDYSLYNKGKPTRTHYFNLVTGDGLPLVSMPKVPWTGDHKRKSHDNVTIVCLTAFGDLVEDICIKLINLAVNDQIEVVLPGGSDELLDRYSGVFKTLNS